MALVPAAPLPGLVAAAAGIQALTQAYNVYGPRIGAAISSFDRTARGVKRALTGSGSTMPAFKRRRTTGRAVTRRRRTPFKRRRTTYRKRRGGFRRRTFKRRARRGKYIAKSFIKQKHVWFKNIQNFSIQYELNKDNPFPTASEYTQVDWLPAPANFPVKNAMFDAFQERFLKYVVVKYNNFRVWRKNHFLPDLDLIEDRKKSKIYWYHRRDEKEGWPQAPSMGDEEPYNAFIINGPSSGFTMRYKPDTRSYTGDTLQDLKLKYNVAHGFAKYLFDHDDKLSSKATGKEGYTFDVKLALDITVPAAAYVNEVKPSKDQYDWIDSFITFDVTTWTKWGLRRPQPYGAVATKVQLGTTIEEQLNKDI